MEPPVQRGGEDGVGLRREDDGAERGRPRCERQEGLPGRGVVDLDASRGVSRHEALVPPRGREARDGGRRAAGTRGSSPAAASRPFLGLDDLPGGDASGGVARDEGPVAVQEAEDRDGGSRGAARRRSPPASGSPRRGGRTGRSPGRGAGEDVLPADVERQGRHFARRVDGRTTRTSSRVVSPIRLVFSTTLTRVSSRGPVATRAIGPSGPRTYLKTAGGLPCRVDDHRSPRPDGRRHAPLPLVVRDLRRDRDGIEAAVGEPEDDQLRLRRDGLHDRGLAEAGQLRRGRLAPRHREDQEAALRRDEGLLAVLVDGQRERERPGRQRAGRDGGGRGGPQERPDHRHDDEEDRPGSRR